MSTTIGSELMLVSVSQYHCCALNGDTLCLIAGTADKDKPQSHPGPGNATSPCEHFIGTLKRECLDHMRILHRAQLRRLVAEFVGYYNHSRPHQGIGQCTPARFDEEYHPQSGRIRSVPVLSGLHHSLVFPARFGGWEKQPGQHWSYGLVRDWTGVQSPNSSYA